MRKLDKLNITDLEKENFSVKLRRGELKKLIKLAISALSEKNSRKPNNKQLARFLKESCKSLRNPTEKSIGDSYIALWKYNDDFIPLDCLEELCKLTNKNFSELEGKIERIKLRILKNSIGIPIESLTKIEKEEREEMISLPGFFRAIVNTYRKLTHQFELVIYNSKFVKKVEEISKNNRNLARAIVELGDKNAIIKKNIFGNLLRAYPDSQTVRISIGNSLSRERKSEIIKKTANKNFGLRVGILINPKEWNFSVSDRFLESKENMELARKLINLNYKIFTVTTNDPNKLKYGIADLVLEFKKFKIPIEITTLQPTKLKINSKKPNAPHGSTWVRITGRILQIFLYGLENHVPSFVIINEKWKEYKHCRVLVQKLRNFGCFVFFSNFQNNWFKEIAKKIVETLRDVSYDLPWY